MKKLAIFLSFVTISALTGCGPSEEEAKKLGFKDAKEMVEIQKAGYQTKMEWDERYKKYGYSSIGEYEKGLLIGVENKANLDDIERTYTPEWFENNCRSKITSEYDASCKGKKVIWTGEITGFSDKDGVHIQLLQNNKSVVNGVKLPEIDSPSLIAKGVDRSKLGYLIEFSGLIGNKNFIYPDVDAVSWYELEKNGAINAPARISKRQLKSECDYQVASSVGAFARNSNYRLSLPLSEIGFYIAAMNQKGFEYEDSKGELINAGSAKYETRELPACLEEVRLKFVNKFAGKRESACFNIAYLRDREFSMYRKIEVFHCEDIDKKIAPWLKENGVSNFY